MLALCGVAYRLMGNDCSFTKRPGHIHGSDSTATNLSQDINGAHFGDLQLPGRQDPPEVWKCHRGLSLKQVIWDHPFFGDLAIDVMAALSCDIVPGGLHATHLLFPLIEVLTRHRISDLDLVVLRKFS